MEAPMDRAPVDRAAAWNLAAATAARAAQEANAMNQKSFVRINGNAWGDEGGATEGKRNTEVRSILVRDLPRHLSRDDATDALRALFSESTRPNAGKPNRVQPHEANVLHPPVPARQGALPQSSWRNNRQYGDEGSRKAAPQTAKALDQEGQLLQQLPYSLSSIRVASDQLGGSAYAFVDFSDELLASLAIEVLGQSAILPGTLSQVRLSLHETWSSPLLVDQYHLYVAGLPPGTNAEQVEAVVTAAAGVAPSHVKLSSVAGTPTRIGVREYAFLRYHSEQIAAVALPRLEEASTSLYLMARKVYEHRRRGARAEPLTHAANCSIFIANLPPMTNSEELKEICSYFDVVRAAEVHPTRNFGFVRLACHEAALAAITHLHGMQLHGRTLACSWSSRCLVPNIEESRNDAWERAEEAYAVMSSQCMDCSKTPSQQLSTSEKRHKPTPSDAQKDATTHAAGEAFWLSLLAEKGPITFTEYCFKTKQQQQHAQEVQSRLQLWQAQEWEEDVEDLPQ
ncbi:hypothetical protein Efla_003162 [Eimeria flavescens]